MSFQKEYIEKCIQELYKLRDSLNVNRMTVLSTSWDRIRRAIRPESLRQSIADVNRYCEQINRDVTLETFKVSKSAKEEVALVHSVLTKRYQEEDHTKLLSWISTWNFQERHKYLLQRHHEGTGEWLLEREDFMDWRNGVEANVEEKEVPRIYWCSVMRKYTRTILTANLALRA